MKLEKLHAYDKSHLRVKHICPPSIISNVTNNTMTFENLLDNLVPKVLS